MKKTINLKKTVYVIIPLVILFLFIFAGSLFFRIVMRSVNREINGSFSVKSANVRPGRISLYEPVLLANDGSRIFSSQEITVHYNLLKLLTGLGSLSSIKKLEIKSPYLKIIRNSRGVFNYDDLFKRKPVFIEWDKLFKDYKGSLVIDNGIIEFSDSLNKSFSKSLKRVTVSILPEKNSKNLSLKVFGILEGKNPMRISGLGNLKFFPPAANLNINVKNVDLKSFSQLFVNVKEVKPRSGTADIRISLKGSGRTYDHFFDSVYVSGVSEIYGGALSLEFPGSKPVGINRIYGRMHFTPCVLNIDNISGRFNDSKITIKGQVYDPTNPSLDLYISTESINIGEFKKLCLPGEKTVLKGRLTSSLHIDGFAGNPVVRGLFKVTKARINEIDIKEALIKTVITSGLIKVDEISALINGGAVKGKGFIFSKSRQVVFNIDGHDAPFLFKGNSSKDIGGIADFSLNILGRISKPTFIGKATVNNLSIGGEKFDSSYCNFLVNGSSVFLKEGIIKKQKGALRASGFVDFKDKRMDMNLACKYFPVPDLRFPDIGMLDGEISCVMRVCGSITSPVLTGAISDSCVKLACKGVINKISLTKITTPVCYDGEVFSIGGGSASVFGSKIRFNAAAMLKNSLFGKINLTIAKLNYKSISGLLPLTLPVVLNGTGNLSLMLAGSPDEGFLWNISGSNGKGVVKTSGLTGRAIDKNMISYITVLKMPLKNIDISKICRTSVDGNIRNGIAILLANAGKWSIYSSMNFSGGAISGFPVSYIIGDIMLRDLLVTISGCDVRGLAGRISVCGNTDVKGKSFDLKTTGANLDVGYLCRNLDLSSFGINTGQLFKGKGWLSIKGCAWAEGDLRGSLASPYFTGTVSMLNGVFENEPLSLKAAYTIDKNQSVLKDGRVSIGRSLYTGKGRISNQKDKSLDFKIAAEKGDISKLLILSPWKDIPLLGDLNGSFEIKGDSQHPLLNGNAVLSNAVYNNQPIKEIRADLKTIGKNLNIENLEILFPDAKVRGSGFISYDGKIDMNMSSEKFRLSQLDSLEKYVGDIDGNLDFNIKIEGTRKEPKAIIDFIAKDIKAGGEIFDQGNGKIHWEGNTLYLDSISVNRDKECYKLSGSIIYPPQTLTPSSKGNEKNNANPEVDITADIINGRLETILQYISPALKKEMKGMVDGQFALKGNVKKPSVNLKLSVKEGTIKNLPVEKMDANLTFENQNCHIENINLKTSKSSVDIKGDVDFDGNNDLSVDIKNLDLALISTVLPSLLPKKYVYSIGGNLDMKAKIGGVYQFPDVTSTIKVSNGYISGFDFEGLEGNINSKKGVFTLNDFYIIEKGNRVSVKGNIPLMFEKKGFLCTAPLEIRCNIKENDLDILSLFVPMEGTTSGVLLGRLIAFGFFPDIVMEGALSIKDGEFQPVFLKKQLTNIKTAIKIQNDKIMVKNIEGRLGQGTFTIGGELDLAGYSIKNVDLAILGKNLAVFAKKYFSGNADINARLKGDNREQLLVGNITTRNSTYNIPTEVLMREPEENEKLLKELKDSIPSQLRNILVKLELDLEKDNWLTFMTSSFLTQGSLSLVGRIPDLAVIGDVNLYRGTLNIPFLETPFKVYQGKAHFDGQDWSPYLNIDAEADIGIYRVYMDMEGKLEKPKVTLSSEPPLHQDEVERMVAGSAFTNFVPGGALQANAMATRLAERILDLNLVQPIFQVLGRTFALTDVSLEYTYEGSWSVKLAKALDNKERLLLTFERIMGYYGEVHRLWGIEYRFKHGMLFRLAQDESGNNYVWIQAKYSF